jgi:NitT/TauT family transport system substrate-binding protein
MHKVLRSLALVLVISGSFSTATQAATVVTMGAAQLSAGSLPIIVAEQKGLFEAEGVTIKRHQN